MVEELLDPGTAATAPVPAPAPAATHVPASSLAQAPAAEVTVRAQGQFVIPRPSELHADPAPAVHSGLTNGAEAGATPSRIGFGFVAVIRDAILPTLADVVRWAGMTAAIILVAALFGALVASWISPRLP